MQEFILLIRLSTIPLLPEQTAQLTQNWGKLVSSLRAQGKFVEGYIFSGDGFTVQGMGGAIITPQITAEHDKYSAGCVVICANAMEEAVQIAQQCPPLAFGGSIEVRQRQPQPQPVTN